MKVYPESYNVAVTFLFTDLNGQQITPTGVSAKLFDGDDQLIIDFGALPFDAATGNKEIVVPAEFNALGQGELQAARILRAAITTADGVIHRSSSYIIQAEARLAVMINSFMTLEAAEILALDVPNLTAWAGALEDDKMAALIDAYNRITRIPVHFSPVEDTDSTCRYETIIRANGWPDVTESDFMAWPGYFRKRLRRAQLIEANERLNGDVVASKHRAGIISETVGQSSVMLRGGRLDYGVSSEAMRQLAGHIHYEFKIERA